MLPLLSEHINKDLLGCIGLNKKFQTLSKEKDLEIIVQCNLKITNYLDITFNINDGSYHPYRKPNKETNYIHVKSTTPHQSLNTFHDQLKKDSQFCHHQKIFFWSQPITMKNFYKIVDIKLSYNINNQMKRIVTRRKRNIIWFKQPQSKSVKTNIERIMVKRKKLLQSKPTEPQKLCNCFLKEDYPMNGLCLTSSILYQATIKCNDSKYKQKGYKGICETNFKKCFANHKKTFNLIKSKNDTNLSIEYWTLKQKQQGPRVQRTIKGIQWLWVQILVIVGSNLTQANFL